MKERIEMTQVEIFPLDRLLPLDSVYSIFLKEYQQEENKKLFLDNRKWSRLREGYYALFAALSRSIFRDMSYCLYFPLDPSNDFYMIEMAQDNNSKAYCFDVKEYTEYSKSFEDFLEKSIFPILKRGIYDLVIGLHRKVSFIQLQSICDYLEHQNSPGVVFLVGAYAEENVDERIARVVALSKRGIISNEVINLDNYLKKLEAILVFQNKVKFKSFDDK